MFEITISGKAPIYEQLYNGISELISSGRLAAGERLPAVREVAKSLGINPNTVQKAYFLLEQSGLINSIPAKGSYVADSTTALAALKTQALERLGAELSAAKRAGVSEPEAQQLLKSIYTQTKEET